jgi:hypothetical protein
VTDRQPRSTGYHRAFAVVAAAVIAGAGLTGCGAVKAVKAVNHVRQNVAADRSTITTFAATLQSGSATPFVATYTTSGHSPATVRYAVQPPDRLDFSDSPAGKPGQAGSIALHLIVNSAGEYSCSTPPARSSSGPACQKLGAAGAARRNKILDIYTPAHWANLLKGLAVAAGLAGDRIGTSLRTVNGFALNCVDFHAPGVPGSTTICTTKQGILGYIKVASDATSFRITSYSAAPAASLFELPQGATVTTSR